MKKKIIIMLILILSIGFFTGCGKKDKEVVKNAYSFYFEGGNNKITYRTYIYKVNNNQDNYGFRYVNTTKKKIDNKEVEIIVSEGEVTWTEDVFTVAKKHGSYSYVVQDGIKYSINEFMQMFLMD